MYFFDHDFVIFILAFFELPCVVVQLLDDCLIRCSLPAAYRAACKQSILMRHEILQNLSVVIFCEKAKHMQKSGNGT